MKRLTRWKPMERSNQNHMRDKERRVVMKAKSIEPLVVSAIEAAEMLRTGVHVVYPLIERGEIPAYRVGCNWKVPITKLQQYVEEKAEAEAVRKTYGSSERKFKQ